MNIVQTPAQMAHIERVGAKIDSLRAEFPDEYVAFLAETLEFIGAAKSRSGIDRIMRKYKGTLHLVQIDPLPLPTTPKPKETS